MHQDPGLNILGRGYRLAGCRIVSMNDWNYVQGGPLKVLTFNIKGKLSRIESRSI